MGMILLLLLVIVVVDGRKTLRHETTLTAKLDLDATSKLELFEKMMREAPPKESLGNSKCPGQPSYCTAYTEKETPFAFTLTAQTKVFGQMMRSAFGEDIGNIWEAYLSRRYATNKWTGKKVKLVEDIDPKMFHDGRNPSPYILMTKNIQRQFQGDPGSIDAFEVALDDATIRLSAFVACHQSEFSVPNTPVPAEPKFHSDVSWFSVDFAPLLEKGNTRANGKPPGYVDINYSGYSTLDECHDVLYHAPSNLAGGKGDSDYGDDLRYFHGHLHCQAIRTEENGVSFVGVRCKSKVKLEVFDAVDFCPGGCGTSREQILTVPFSRREASGLAYDVPIHVNVWMPVKTSEARVGSATSEQCASWFDSTSMLSMSNIQLNMDSAHVVNMDFNENEHKEAREVVLKQCKAPIYSAGPLLKQISKLI